MLNSVKNALRWVKTVNALVLASWVVIFSPHSAYASSHCVGKDEDAGYSPNGGCADGNSSIAIGFNSQALDTTTTALGAFARANGINALAIGTSANATRSSTTAVGTDAFAKHIRSSAFGYRAQTSADHQMVFGTSGTGFSATNFAQVIPSHRTSYVFDGLAIPESVIRAAMPDLAGLGEFTEGQKVDDASVRNAHTAAVRGYRNGVKPRVLQVNGHGGLVAVSADDIEIGSADQDASGSGTIYQRLHSLRSQMGSGGYDDSEVRGLINANASGVEKASQGVALSNALASLPKALLPGERLRLGIGVGSFDGKSGTAIGVMGKWGASTLLNAGFSTGGGESSTQIGISWGW